MASTVSVATIRLARLTVSNRIYSTKKIFQILSKDNPDS